ncbi:MAG: class I poly(R)-hydroxyalkanoic acid synthase [Betaproteobacteria bacterium RIFCSPLOWO2_02_FULL_67_26]|nr:MAG: class I poly(R)-hydroxyalkanoic acid synthase [Betaproteobacteria bacterium RIFCSPLOWO2_02_FULL_67_26]
MNDTRGNPSTARPSLDALNRGLIEGISKPLGLNAGFDVPEIIRSLTAGLAQDNERWLEIQNRYYRKRLELWAAYAQPKGAAPPPPLVEPDPADRRFRAPEWREAPYFEYLTQSYLLTARWLREVIGSARLEPHAKRKLEFLVRQFADAMSPANFPWTNPEALKLAAATEGDSLTKGLRNLAADLDKGMVSMTDETAFEVGRNLAIQPGTVIYQNDFMQLIQYRPATDTVFERPLVMVPPCINKYYILDLQPENSFVRYAIEQGHTVFMVSWRNVPREMGRATWDDYLEHGVMKALSVAGEVCGGGKVNALGFCVGGTLLGAALAVLRARGDDSVASLTLLASMLDFSDTGELSVFVDEAYVAQRERDFADGGLLHGRELALTFASLRANDLIWHYVVNNYLKGRTPEPFDLLYWNSDSTNLPGVMYAYYVRNMYLENNLRAPGKLTMCGVPVDLGRVDLPAYVLATREDHIVPWRTAYASGRLLGGRIDFVLSASGHIAGVVNPASKNRRNFWLNPTLEADTERWFAAAVSSPGSWWKHWSDWLARSGGAQVAARRALGGNGYREIEPAPGRYVKEKCG